MLRHGDPATDAEQLIERYDAHNRRLAEVELNVLVDAARQLAAERRRIMTAMLAAKNAWPELREALNTIENVAAGRIAPRRPLARRRGEPPSARE